MLSRQPGEVKKRVDNGSSKQGAAGGLGCVLPGAERDHLYYGSVQEMEASSGGKIWQIEAITEQLKAKWLWVSTLAAQWNHLDK